MTSTGGVGGTGDTTDTVTLAQLLDLPVLDGTRVLAGADGMTRPVTGANVMEVPDVVAWVKPHELLVTTGFPLTTAGSPDSEQHVEQLTSLVRDLDERRLAGLAVKLGRYLDEMPSEVLALADERSFPVLALSADLAFDDLLPQVYSRLHEHQTEVLSRIDALHTALTLLVLEGGNLDNIAAEVGRVLGVGVLVTSTDGRERAASLTPELRAALAKADLFDESGRFRVERTSRSPLPFGHGEIRLQPVAAAGSDLARLVCVSPHGVLASSDVSALERAATVAALLITREQAVTAVENKYAGDFLRDVFLGRAGDRAYVVEHAAALGWDLDRPLLVAVAELDPPAPDEPPVSGRVQRTWQERFATAWRQVCRAVDPTIPTVDFSGEVIVLVPVPGEPDRLAAEPLLVRDRMAAAVTDLVGAVAGDRGGGRRPFSIGVSRVAQTLSDLPEAYNQARRATDVGRRVHGGSTTTWFDDLGIHRLLALVPDPAELRAFARDVLGDLAGDGDDAADLRRTLQVLLDTNLNVAESARLQFFHYNTMRYRVGKLERMLGPFTTDPHLRLDVAVALQALDG